MYMAHEVWVATAVFSANFMLVSDEQIVGAVKPHPSILMLKLEPIISENGRPSGNHKIEISYSVPHNEGEKSTAHIVTDIGREIFQLIIDTVTFLTAQPVLIVQPLGFTHHFPETNNYRTVAVSSEYGYLSEPIILDYSSLLSARIDEKHRRILAWFSRGISDKDIVNSIFYLFTSLEILANQFPCPDKTTRKCEKCGYTKTLEAGMRQKIQYFLINTIGLEKHNFERIWTLRNSLSHGGLDLHAEDLRDMTTVKNNLTIAIIKGLKILLCIPEDNPPIAKAPMIDFADALLDVTYSI